MPPTENHYDGTGGLGKRVKNYGTAPNSSQEKNYFIRSSVLNKVVSETDETGGKVKTFVSANGVTLAEQLLVTYNGATTEELSFIHQDPSGASLQTTNESGDLAQSGIRTGEYDALGRNVADANPYLISNSQLPPDEDGSGILLGGTSQGYRPGRNTYVMDGIAVSEEYFTSVINGGAIGGMFGLLEMSVKMWAQPPRKIGEWW